MEAIINNLFYILNGIGTTVKLALGTAVLSIPLGALAAVGKVSGGKALKTVLSFYTWLFRGTPLLLQVFFVYYGLPILSPKLTISSGFAAALLTFVLNYAAYFTEIFRGGIESIDKGQYEASKAMGFGYWQTMVYIIFPQTVRRVIPTTSSEMVNLVKDTALVAAIGLGDLLRSSREIVTKEFIISPFVIAAVVYLMLNSVIMYTFKRIEEKAKIYE
ncbi:arginine transport system permease protein ArtQ [Andreesenia angusta]|uniref:Arginine transport system permease protein ArtQ n=1 Tax=Andreesenia angusta TaxID=39480 RepID=A0A1S1V5L0_9FIRM|nr:amino acid ABC transporter permease [Andreesenia angusta]OHW61804.1 arginine transport system permease protein ArtQ [Andreesenia angusta]